MTAGLHVNKMIEIINEKLMLLESLFGYTLEQSQAINEDDIDRLNSLVDKKSGLIEKIDAIDGKFEAEFTELKAKFGVKSLADIRKDDMKGDIEGMENIDELKACTGKVISMIQKIKVAEEENHGKAKRLIDLLEEKMKKINRGKKLKSVYGDSRKNAPSYFINKKK